ncbi:hypothetical protein N7524_005977 [Penicillium chrysogenum]|nr:hypothetical protein N7524_005977 [Penicillium chrysogenum]
MCATTTSFVRQGMQSPRPRWEHPDDATAHQQFLDDVKDQVQRIFTHLEPNRLSIFEWRLGTCVPVGVLDQGKAISVSTNSASLVSPSSLMGPALKRRTAWKNWSCLDHLSIGFVPSAFARAHAGRAWGFSDRSLRMGWGLGVTLGEDTGIANPTALSALSTLSLSKVTLPLDISSGHNAIFYSLRSLTLRDCPDQLHLVQLLSWSEKPLRLTHFEFSFDYLLHEPGEG